MNAHSTASDIAGTAPEATRPPLKGVRCLLPIWGFAYIKKFLEVALPTWLAPGNLPALAEELPTEFVLLTSRQDEVYLRAHPAFKRLAATVRTRVHYIDHLITGTNYSTTITLAYTEAVRAAGDDLTDTCFFFLVSDYIVADGSFRSVLQRIKAGRSGIQVGNFQVVEEDAEPWLIDRLQESPNVLSLSSRELMGWALSHLHPATIANTVDYGMMHNSHTNRLFWRVDNRTLIGRFYLIHMIAIRPELKDFVIGSSCDYSFIPEMCPSGNVEIIGDSDDYLVIEMQPRLHEAKAIRTGPLMPGALAGSLSEWTTETHRKNAETTVVFHADEVPETIAGKTADADAFLAEVKTKLRPTARPHRHHPYWSGAVASFNEATGSRLSDKDWRLALGLPNPELEDVSGNRWMLERLRFVLFGRPPHVRPWHPRHPDHSLVLKALETKTTEVNARLLLVADRPTMFTASFQDGGERVVRLRTSHMLKQPPEVYEPLHGAFELCLLEMDEIEFPRADEVLDRLAPMMKDGARVLISLRNGRASDPKGEFQRTIGLNAGRLLRPYAVRPVFSFVTASALRARSFSFMYTMIDVIRESPRVGLPLAFLVGGPLAAAFAVGNASAKVKVGSPTEGFVSSALLEISIDAEQARQAYIYSNDRLLRASKNKRLGFEADHRVEVRRDIGRAPGAEPILTGKPSLPINSNGTTMTQKASAMTKPQTADGTREPQYNRCIEIRDQQGLTSLGLMTNQVWEDDPRRLTFLLARYKFVSKMLAGKKIVGELGCGDAFGTRIVMQSTEKVIAYDFDPVFIEDIRQRRSPTWPVEAHFHDILEAPLPNKHDGIYSLDVIEHIERSQEHLYLQNLKDSLTHDGVLIVGSPSLESQTYASPPSKAGHVNCKSGNELKALLEQYFHNVFLFSMNDEVVHTGYAPMAHYLFVIACNKK